MTKLSCIDIDKYYTWWGSACFYRCRCRRMPH